MATPKFDAIIHEFRSRLNDPDTYIGGALQDGNVITAADTISYVNRALNLLFEQTWQAAQGDPLKVAQVLPELITTISGLTFSTVPAYGPHGTLFNAAVSGTNDFAVYITNTIDIPAAAGVIVSTRPYNEISILANNYNTMLTPTATNMFIVPDGRKLYLFPTNAGGNWTGVTLQYIKIPVRPDNGLPLNQNDIYDSPFYPTWTTVLAELAIGIYLKEITEVMA